VVSYVRMSNDKQEDSPDRQRAAISAYAKARGYVVAREYFDAGISGWKDDRPSFNRMIADAKAKLFDVILLDEDGRISRFDPDEHIALVVYPLKEAGVSVESAKSGPMNWNDLGGQLITVVNANTNAEEVKKMSYRVLGGMVQKARAGMWQGAAPFGYKIHRVTDPDRPDRVTDRHLVPGDARHVEAVRWIFSEYASCRRGKAAIASELAKRGIYSPRKGKDGKPKPFSSEAIRLILTNRAYLGEFRWNGKTEGKFHRFKSGQAEKKTAKRVQRNDEADWIVIPKRHDPLIDAETFQNAQARLKGNPAPSTPHADGGGFKLSRLLVCGKCGAWMYGFTAKLKSTTERRYICGTYCQHGKSGRCDYNKVSERTVVRVIGKKLQQFFTDPAALADLRGAVRQQEREQHDPGVRAELERRLNTLDAEIVAGEDRVLRLPEDMVAGAISALRRLKAERETVAAEVATTATRTRPTEDLEKAVSEITARIWRLADVMETGEPMDVRAALSVLLDRVELRFETRQTNKTTRTKLVGGVIHLKQPESLNLASSASRTC
jgi:DNA invertase Pin-like site-specific DNA recombinase